MHDNCWLCYVQLLAKANRERLAVLLNEAEVKKSGNERYAAALRSVPCAG